MFWETPESPANPDVDTLIKAEIKENSFHHGLSLGRPHPTFLLICGSQEILKLTTSGYTPVLTALCTET